MKLVSLQNAYLPLHHSVLSPRRSGARGGKRGGKRGGRGEAGGRKKREGGDEGSQKSDKRAQTIPLLIPLVFNIKREYIISCVVLATPEMLFELAESIRRHVRWFGSWKGLTGGKRGKEEERALV